MPGNVWAELTDECRDLDDGQEREAFRIRPSLFFRLTLLLSLDRLRLILGDQDIVHHHGQIGRVMKIQPSWSNWPRRVTGPGSTVPGCG